MFLPSKLTTMMMCSLISSLLLVSMTHGQQTEFDRRIAAMEQARRRAQQAVDTAMQAMPVVRDANYSVDPANVRSGVGPAQATLVSMQSEQFPSSARGVMVGNRQVRPMVSSQPSIVRSTLVPERYTPQYTRTAQAVDELIIDDGSSIIGSGLNSNDVYIPMEGEYYEGEVIDGGCATCGDVGGYFCNDCNGRGGCPPGPCWLSQIGVLLRQGEYFWGANSFRSPLFPTPGGTAGELSNDFSQGFYGGFNFGVPLCRLTCGLMSGQLGIRSVQTNFDGNQFTNSERNQLFVTTGFYRRVDCGFQFGLVADFLHEEWVTNTDVAQLRGDFGRVYPSGATLGFRFAANIQDDTSSGQVGDVAFTDFYRSTIDNYRFYWRRQTPGGGYGEFQLGWTGTKQTIIGLDFDLPVAERVAVLAGFNYYANGDGLPPNSNYVGGNALEGYNLFVGLSFRPQGLNYYRNYDRPMFAVADNGSMMVIHD